MQTVCSEYEALLRTLRKSWLEQHFLGEDEVFAVVVRQLKVLSQDDCAGGAGVLAVAAEDAAEHIDFVADGVALAGGEAVFFGVLASIDEDAAGGAGSGAEGAADALFEAVVVAGEDVSPAGSWELLTLVFGVHDRWAAVSESLGGNAESGDHGFDDFVEDGHYAVTLSSISWMSRELTSMSRRSESEVARPRLIFSWSFMIP